MTKRMLVAAAILLAFGIIVRIYPFQARVPLRQSFEVFPLEWKGWEGRRQYFTEDIEKNLGVQEYMQRFYRKDLRIVDFYVGYYGAQKAEEQIHSPKHCLPGGGMEKVEESVMERDVPGYGPVRFVRAVYRHGDQQQVFYYWYRMMDKHITNEYLLKASMVWNSLVHRRNDAAFVRLATGVPPRGDLEGAEASLDAFMADFLPLLSSYLPA